MLAVMTKYYTNRVSLHYLFGALAVFLAARFAVSATEVATVATPSEIPHYNCTKKCAFQALQLWDPSNKAYLSCMKNCVKDEWILFENVTCMEKFKEGAYSGEPITCAPALENIKVHEFGFQVKPNGPLNGYLLVIWQPCFFGRDAVEGYQLDIQSSGMRESDCYTLELSRYLDRTEQMTFTAIYPYKLVKGDKYTGYLSSIPYTETDLYSTFTYKTKTCAELNTNGDECVCPDDPVKNYGFPNVTISGYTVSVSADPWPDCKNLYYYQLFVSYKTKLSRNGVSLVNLNFFRNSRRRTIGGTDKVFLAPGERPNTTFSMIYPLAKEANLTTGVVVFNTRITSIVRTYIIEIKPWQPPVPQITELGGGMVDVSFAAAPPEFNITVYAVRLNIHPDNNEISITYRELNVTLDTKDENGNITARFYNVKPGLHNVQIKEVRVSFLPETTYLEKKHKGKIFVDPVWNAPIQFRILSEWDKFKEHALGPVLACVIVIVLTVVAVVLFLYFWKEGYCPHARYYVPAGLAKCLDSQTTSEVAMVSHTVLIVWQSDTRSTELAEKHANVIRHLASFLRSVCGLDVILDMFEQTQMSTALSKWVHDAYEKAEFVIFICPHFECDVEPEDGNFIPLVGDFNYMFKYMEPRIRDRRKFVTALLPYSDVNSCQASKALKNCTILFKLMDQIDDLYLHIQGKSKVTFLGRHSVVYVNRKDYTQTSQGVALFEGIKDIEKLMSEYKKSPSLSKRISLSSSSSSTDPNSSSSFTNSLSEDNVVRTSRCSDVASDMAANHLGVHPPEPVKCLCRKVTDKIHPPLPLVENPEEHIRLINCTSPSAARVTYPENMCPYHNPRITTETSPYTTYTDDGYGEPTNTDLSTSGSSPKDQTDEDNDEAIMRFLRARSLVPQPEIAQISVQTLPTIDTQDSDVFYRPGGPARSLESTDEVSNEAVIERYTTV